MIIIYHCFGGTHSSVMAAAIHTGKLSMVKRPSLEEIIELPHFDKVNSSMIGTPIYYGEDEWRNKIYIQGMGNASQIVKKTLKSFLELEGIDEEAVYLVNTFKYVTIPVRIGGYLSRQLGMVFPGRIIAAIGLRRVYSNFIEEVKKVKQEISIASKV